MLEKLEDTLARYKEGKRSLKEHVDWLLGAFIVECHELALEEKQHGCTSNSIGRPGGVSPYKYQDLQ
jgi:hypothetical protein